MIVDDKLGGDVIKQSIEKPIRQAFSELEIPLNLAICAPSKRQKNVDFQCNGVLAYSNSVGRSPRAVAGEVMALVHANDVFEISVAGPGFLNFRVHDAFLVNQLNSAQQDTHARESDTRRGSVFVDFGGPNVAKEMHVGHLRSALIGQSLTAALKFCGYQVTSDVHLGDWGLQMGLTITQITEKKYVEFDAADLGKIYPIASQRSKQDPDFLNRARACTSALQAKDIETTKIWKKIVSVSAAEIKRTYDRLGVSFDQWNGESKYQEIIPKIIEEARDKGIAKRSDGALIITSEDDDVPPLILETSARSVSYAATDLAALSARVLQHNPSKILYVVDNRQKLHFQQVFAAAKRIGLVGDSIVEHVPFGTVNGNDGRPYKTRDGRVMRLRDLLDLMVEKARDRVAERGHVQNIDAVAEDVAMAAIKYGELSHDRDNDYIFDPDHFLEFEGNTGPYLLYTSVRVKTLVARAKDQGLHPGKVTELGNGGRKIVLILDGFLDVMQRVVEQRKPSVLATYLYGLANEMNAFYQKNQVLAPGVTENSAQAYLAILCSADAQLRAGLDLLGIDIPNQM